MNTYPYRAYIENLFSCGSDVKSNQLKAGEFWYPGAAEKFEDYNSKTAKARNADVAKSIPVEFWGRLHLYLVMQDKYLPNGIGFVCYPLGSENRWSWFEGSQSWVILFLCFSILLALRLPRLG